MFHRLRLTARPTSSYREPPTLAHPSAHEGPGSHSCARYEGRSLRPTPPKTGYRTRADARGIERGEFGWRESSRNVEPARRRGERWQTPRSLRILHQVRRKPRPEPILVPRDRLGTLGHLHGFGEIQLASG